MRGIRLKSTALGLRSVVQSVPRLAGLVGQASCLSLNDGQDARPTEEGTVSGLRPRNYSRILFPVNNFPKNFPMAISREIRCFPRYTGEACGGLVWGGVDV